MLNPSSTAIPYTHALYIEQQGDFNTFNTYA